MTTSPLSGVQVLAAEATTGAAPGLALVSAAELESVAGERPGPRLGVDFGYSDGAELDDRVAALLATIAHAGGGSTLPAALVLVAPVSLDEQCAAAAYAVAGGVTIVVTDQPAAVERAVRVTAALQAHETVAEPVAR